MTHAGTHKYRPGWLLLPAVFFPLASKPRRAILVSHVAVQPMLGELETGWMEGQRDGLLKWLTTKLTNGQ